MHYNRTEILFLSRIINKNSKKDTGNKAYDMIGLWTQNAFKPAAKAQKNTDNNPQIKQIAADSELEYQYSAFQICVNLETLIEVSRPHSGRPSGGIQGYASAVTSAMRFKRPPRRGGRA